MLDSYLDYARADRLAVSAELLDLCSTWFAGRGGIARFANAEAAGKSRFVLGGLGRRRSPIPCQRRLDNRVQWW